MSSKKYKYYTYELDMVFLNVLAIILMVLLIGVLLLMRLHLNMIVHPVILIVSTVLWLCLHEVLHGIGFAIFPEVNKGNITFGIKLEKCVFYCMCKQKISRRVILTSLMFPFTFIGVVTLILGIILENYLLIFLSVINISGAVGDLVMFYYFLKVPKDIIYLDLDDCTSFTVLSDKDLSSIRVGGIRLKESSFYDEKKMFPRDKRRLVISKTSYIVLGILLILSILEGLV